MNELSQTIYRERIDSLHKEITENSDDIEYALRKINQQLFGNYNGFCEFYHDGGKKYKPEDLISWLRFGREEIGESLMHLQALVELIDEIEDEVNKDEVNSSGR